MASKVVPSVNEATQGKQPYADDDARSDRRLEFRFINLDDRHWPLAKMKQAHVKMVVQKLKMLEQMTVPQAIKNGILIQYDMAKCPNKQAIKALQQLFDGREDSIARLVIKGGGAERLFGVRNDNVIRLIWWDPNHEVWPEGKVKR